MKGAPQADAQGYEYTIVIHVTNNTDTELVWAGDAAGSNGNINPPTAQTVPANGGTSTVFFNSSNVEGGAVIPTWTLQGSSQTVRGIFSVPPLAANHSRCDGNPRPTTCSIDKGYHPNAGLIFSN